MSRYTIILSTFKHAGTVEKKATSKKTANTEFDLLAKDGARLMNLSSQDIALVRIYDAKAKQSIKITREAEITSQSITESEPDKYK